MLLGASTLLVAVAIVVRVASLPPASPVAESQPGPDGTVEEGTEGQEAEELHPVATVPRLTEEEMDARDGLLPRPLRVAWKKAGAGVGWIQGLSRPAFREARDDLDPWLNTGRGLRVLGEVPGFEFKSWSPTLTADLPAPQSPFGISLTGTETTDAGLKELVRFKSLQVLYLAHTSVTDAGLEELPALPDLQALDLSDTQVTDAGLKSLSALKGLRSLTLARTKVTDAGLKSLGRLTKLETLDLANTPVTEAGLQALRGLEELRNLDLEGTAITDRGRKELGGLKKLWEKDELIRQIVEDILKH
jgi:Leucine-rich repeat (LRR) protein